MRRALLVALAGLLVAATPRVDRDINLFVTDTMGNRLNNGTGATISVMLDSGNETSAHFVLEYGTSPTALSARTAPQVATDDTRVDFVLTGLSQGTRYFYRVNAKPIEDTGWGMGAVHSFTTARATGAKFKMAFVADSHIYSLWTRANCGDSTDSDYYKIPFFNQTVANIRNAGPDLVLFGGDEFYLHSNLVAACNVDGATAGAKTIDDANEAERRHRQWGRLLLRLFQDIPFHISLGNHDGEVSWGNATGVRDCNHWDGLDALAQAARLKYWVNPNTAYSAANGSVNGDYYAFMPSEDVEIFVLTPHKYGVSGPDYPADYPEAANDWQLGPGGADQAAWLATELNNSTATWKLIATHGLPGGCENTAHSCYWYGRADVLCSADGTVDTDIQGTNAQALHDAAEAEDAHILLAHDHIAWTAQKDGTVYIRGGRAGEPATTPAGNPRPGWSDDADIIALYDLDANGTADYDEIGGSDHASREGGYMLFTFDGTTSMTWEYIITDTTGDDNEKVDFRCVLTDPATPDLNCVDVN
jgi:hypothetical protein